MRTAVTRPRCLAPLLGAAVLLTAPAAWATPSTPSAAGAVAAAHAPPVATAGERPAALAAESPTGYRYWSFWLHDGDGGDTTADGDDWRYATQGPGTLRPADGAVLGFRFGIGASARDAGRPRDAPSFGVICADVPETSGERRVALVLDFGTAEEAPDGERPPEPATACALLPDGATAAEALAAEAEPLRYARSGLLCAIRGYPEHGCGEEATASTTDPSDTNTDTDTAEPDGSAGPTSDPGGDGVPGGAGLWLGVAAVALLSAAALGRGRRRER
ncbi:SCO2322 family protein [Streptomyces sp. SM14]|uniref:SCO2322 family protein n=1 Tax=Streptomyces sp. SM14 TaxID=1736045 RepID=UPI000CD4C692|nr:SCO2322 family protein [Streptomyces sp. SM14]